MKNRMNKPRDIYRLNRKPTRQYIKTTGERRTYHRYLFSVPAVVGDAAFAAGVTDFVVEVTDDGILYRPTSLVPPVVTVTPAWLKEKA